MEEETKKDEVQMKHVESHIQQACVRWFSLQWREYSPLLYAVPNGARTSESQARILKAEGMKAGVADLILSIPSKGYHGMFIEMKTPKGRQSDTQKTFQKAVEAQGYKYIIVRSFEDFRKEVNAYLTV